MANRFNEVVEAIENNLDDDRECDSAYNMEDAADLVKMSSKRKTI
jgi:hypothetical protein